jgi:hypothetical protein
MGDFSNRDEFRQMREILLMNSAETAVKAAIAAKAKR